MKEKKTAFQDDIDHFAKIEKKEVIEEKSDNTNENKVPFNDVIDHFDKIEGNATNMIDTDFKGLPKPIRYIGYFMIAFIAISFLILIILNLLH